MTEHEGLDDQEKVLEFDVARAAMATVEGKKVPLVVYMGGERIVIGEAVVQNTLGMGFIGTPDSDLERAHQIAQQLELPFGSAFGFKLPVVLEELKLSPDD